MTDRWPTHRARSTGDRTRNLVAMDKEYVWHPFTQMKDWIAGDPLVIERGEGCYLVDTDGNRYFDGVSSLWVNVHGHGHPRICAAIKEQTDRLAHSTLLGLANEPSARLAQRLIEIAPAGLTKVFYSDSGSTAVEIALKMAFQFWTLTGQPKRRRFVSLTGAYHGDTLGAVSVGGMALFHETFRPLLFAGELVESPAPYRHSTGGTPEACRDASLAQLSSVLEARGEEIAAVILEPLVQGAAGMWVHPPGFLAGVSRLCREHDVLLIADEVATGFGRTGKMFACEHESVQPDLLCAAKGITGGTVPLAVTLATERVFEAFLGRAGEHKQLFHGHTYTGNPVACAAALASLDLFEEDRVLERMAPKVETFSAALARELGEVEHVGDIRQRGFMVGVELVEERGARRAFAVDERVGARVCARAREHGAIVRPLGDVVVLMPPLVSAADELESLVGAVRSAIVDEGLQGSVRQGTNE